MVDDSLFLIDIDRILQEKVPKYIKYIPKSVVSYLKRIVHQDELNVFLKESRGKVGVELLQARPEFLDAKLIVKGEGDLSKDGLYTFVSNRSLGGQDGVALGYMFGIYYGGEVKYVVNDLFMDLHSLAPLYTLTNKTGRRAKDFPRIVEVGFTSDDQLIIFPAGLCSRYQNGVTRDLDWKKAFMVKNVKTHRDVVSIYLKGRNSNFFYDLANFYKVLDVKFNIAMLCLVDKTLKNRHKTFTITIGKPIPWQTFDKTKTPA